MKYKFSICRTIASIFVVLIPTAAILIGARAWIFLNIPSFVVTFGLCFFMLLAVYEIEFLKFIPHSLRVFFFKPLEPNPRFSQIALFASRSILGAGIIGMTIGVIQMLTSLSEPSELGIGTATALTCPFYAIIVSEIFLAVIHQSFKNTKVKTEGSTTIPLINAGLPLFMVLLTFAICSMLMVTLTK